MATRSFLLKDEIEEGRERLALTREFPHGAAEARRAFSNWLEEKLISRLKSIGDFAALEPVFLGSWSRNELCPKSDIDLLFLGPEDKVQAFVQEAFAQGLKLRARTPEDHEDWSRGVEPFDILALASAVALAPKTNTLLEKQKATVKKFRRKILSAIRKEREERRRRQDSVSSYLEPNLKFGAGGLRDIEQALSLPLLFPDSFEDVDPYPFQVLRQIKEELLYLRANLHLMGSSDVLTAQDQLELAGRLHLESSSELMKLIQSELERASFYADWAVACAGLKSDLSKPFEDVFEALKRLKAEPDVITQFQIRRQVEDLHKKIGRRDIGAILQKALGGECEDALLVGLYRTRLLEQWVPDLKKIRGLVQHDHYHRYTADAHLVQTIREVERVRRRPRILGRLHKTAAAFTTNDWWTLKLTALFHDLAKGRKGDHSTEGAKLVNSYGESWGYPASLIEDVRWLVENHLILSTAAFRQNPRSQSTWKRLFEKGVEGRRLNLLTVFTAIDIRATNPEAWTDWKGQLLADLNESMQSREARQFHSHLQYARKHKVTQADEWIQALDPVVLETFAPKVLVEDLRQAGQSETDLPVRVLPAKGARGKVWVRFHRTKDETGVFLNFVRRLYGFGLNIQTASVHTLPTVGVYDWICVRTDKPARQVADWLNRPASTAPQALPKVEFQSIELMAQDQDEWIFSFRGRDQRGLLAAAASALADENLSLRWARAHTWGQQVDDIFSVQPFGEVETVLEKLKDRFVT